METWLLHKFLVCKKPYPKTHPFKTVQINTYLKDYTSPSRDYNYGYKIPPKKYEKQNEHGCPFLPGDVGGHFLYAVFCWPFFPIRDLWM